MIQNGSPDACTELIQRNAGLIHQLAVGMAKQYPSAALTYEDYEQEGRLALLRAARRFDPGKGHFLTFAATVIRSAMIDALRRDHPEISIVSWERLPQNAEAVREPYLYADLDPYRKTPEQICLKKEQLDELYAAMGQASLRENAWVRHRFGFDDEPCTLTSAARQYGLSESRARRIETQALSHIRQNLLSRSWEKEAS